MGRKLVSELKTGDRARIVSAQTPAGQPSHKLIALGIVPAMDLEVLQVSPVYVLQIGYTQIALGDEFVKRIVVEVRK